MTMNFRRFNKNFPFGDMPNTMCFTCCHVLDNNKPILYVSHDEDGCWQFLCGQMHSQEDARIISLSEIISFDKNILKLGDLQCGEYACFEENKRKWRVFKK